MKRDIDLLYMISDYCEDIEETVERFGDRYDTFINDMDYYRSVGMSMMQMGELCGSLSRKFKDTNPGVDWQAIRGMRNKFAHTFNEMNERAIWNAVKTTVPCIYRFCEEKIGAEENE